MRRREFIAALGGAAAAWPLCARGQQLTRSPTIGFMGTSTPAVEGERLAAFVQRLGQNGWSEGRNIRIEHRWGEARLERFTEIAAEFVRLGVDVIVTAGAAPVLTAKRATSTIPIVFAVAVDPVGSGLVASLARPGGNVTGLSLQSADLVSKRLELLREVVPHIGRLAIMANVDQLGAAREMAEVRTTARTLGMEAFTLEIKDKQSISPALMALKDRAQALYVCPDPLVTANQKHINVLAQDAGIPTMHGSREYVQTGGLISYGTSFPDLYRRAADYVDKILRGAKPADLPVEQPTKFELVINLKTAKALGLAVPPLLLARADEVIE